ncbi:MAG: hypothetical protein ACRDVE_20390 [Actinocrinis sp.]
MRREHVRALTAAASGRRLSGIAALVVPLGAALAAVLLSSGPANAGTGYGQLIVNPGTAAPGQSVSVLGTCPNNGMGLKGVYSKAFAGGLASVKQTSINFSGSATIANGASGTYTVTADCGTGSPSVNLTVSGAGAVTSTAPVGKPSTKAPTTMPPATRPAGGSSMMPGTAHSAMGGMQVSASPAAAVVGGASPARPMSPNPSASGMGTASGATASGNAMSAAPGGSAAGNGPVTSTGIVRVGLAGSSNPLTGTVAAAVVAVALVLAGIGGIVLLRRHKSNTSGTHI